MWKHNIPPEAMKALDNILIDKFHLNKYWIKGILVQLPDKGDRSTVEIGEGIMLLSVPSKALNHIILHRMKKKVDKVLRDEQAGFR